MKRAMFAILLAAAISACSADETGPSFESPSSATGTGARDGEGGEGGAGGDGAHGTAGGASEGGSGGSATGGGGAGEGGAPPASCGDGDVDSNEQCDDGNNEDGDGCAANCSFEPTGPADVCPGLEITLTGIGEEPRIGTASGSTSGMLNQYGSFCGGSGAEAVYAVITDVTGLLTASLSADYDSALHARGACGTDVSELDCDDTSELGGGGEVISFQVASGQTYWLFVDGYGGSIGNYTLDVVVETAFCGNGDAEAPETCDDGNTTDFDGCTSCSLDPGGVVDDCPGQAIFLHGTGGEPRHIGLLGDTTPLAGGISPTSCSGGGNNAVYAITPDVDGSMEVFLVAAYDDATLHVRGECDTSGTQLDCVEATEAKQTLQVAVPVFANTTYYVLADSQSSTKSGQFELDITITPGGCGNDVLDGGEECDDGNAATGDGCDPSCFLEPPAGGNNDTCSGAPLALAGSGTDPRVGVVTATTETLASNYGASPCTGGTASSSAKDAVYVVTPDLTGKMNATVTGQFDTAVYVRSVCTSTGSTDLLGCVDKLDGNSPEVLSVPVVAGSSYWVFVDAPTSTQAGVFELSIEVTAAVCGDGLPDGGEGCDDNNQLPGDGCDASCQLEPVGSNDVCPGQPLALVDLGNGSFSADVQAGNTNLSSTSNVSLTGCTSTGRDAIYAVTSPIDGVMVASVPIAAFNTSLGAQTTCGTSTSQVICSNDNTGSGGEEIAFAVTAGTTYYLIVDSSSVTNPVGPFQLSVLVNPPGCGDGLVSVGEVCDDGNLVAGDGCDESCTLELSSGNDVCPGNAVTLVGSGEDPRTATVTSDTTPLAASYGGSCGGSARDAVYVVTPDIDGTLTAKLTAGFDTVLYARTVCLDAGTEIECDDVLSAGATSISFSVVANDPYFIFVDGFSGAFGVSTLDITVTP